VNGFAPTPATFLASVPEPSSPVLAIAGAAGLVMIARRKWAGERERPGDPIRGAGAKVRGLAGTDGQPSCGARMPIS
jgi:hypothetical protein